MKAIEPIATKSWQGAYVTIALIVVIGLWLGWAYWGVGWMTRLSFGDAATAGENVDRIARAGQVGDLFGGVNALFAAIACVGVFWAGALQYQQLKDARHAYAKERETTEQKDSEAFFFQLVDVVAAMAARLEIADEFLGTKKKVDVQMAWYVDLVLSNAGDGDNILGEQVFEEMNSEIAKLINVNRASLAPFFRVAFQLFVWLDSHPNLPQEKRNAYADIAKAQLSGGIANLLSIFALHSRGAYFFNTVTRYGLLEHSLRASRFKKVLKVRYPEDAFDAKA